MVLFYRAFSKQCRITEKSNLNQTESLISNVSIGDSVFPPLIGVIGDDFLRSLIGSELFGSDFSDDDGNFKFFF